MKTSVASAPKSSNGSEIKTKQTNRFDMNVNFDRHTGVMQENYFRPCTHGYYIPSGSVCPNGLWF